MKDGGDSQLLRIRQAWLALPVGIGVLAAAPGPGPQTAAGQTLPDTSYRILNPVLDGDRSNPPRFRKPPPRAAAGADEPVPFAGYVPRFGNLPSGAGDTGFIATGGPRKKRQPGALTRQPAAAAGQTKAGPGQSAVAQSPTPSPAAEPPPPPSPSAPPPPGTPRIAATSTLIGGPAIAGGIPSDPTAPQRRRPPPEADPFDPLGLRLGTFLVHSAVEVTTGRDSNPSRAPAGSTPSWLLSVAPELHAKSQWSLHEVSVDVLGSYLWLPSDSKVNRPNVDAKVNGRIDVTSHDRVDMQGRFFLSTDYPGSPNVPFDIAKLPIYTDVGATLGYGHTFNRLDVSLKGTFDRYTYQDSLLTDGETSSNADRDYNQYGAVLRSSYELNPGLKPFASIEADERIHDLPADRLGLHRDSQGITPRIGAAVDWGGELKGEFSVGYTNWTYADSRLPALRGPVFDGALIWTATGLTTATLTAQSFVNESTLFGVSGVLSNLLTLQVDHAIRRWLIGTARLADEIDEYQGSLRTDHRYVASIGMTYILTRALRVRGEVRREWLRSSIPLQDYSANIFLLGIRAQN
jgi:hypothetical protein